MNFISPPQTKNPGEDVTFKCAVSKPKEVLVQWLKDGRAITLGGLLAFNDPRLKIEVDEHENSYSLTVSSSIFLIFKLLTCLNVSLTG